ncbi:hypothetical protein NliqN6_6055 [Naganishia liquefaciens]|uniref:S1 motif domain-containing protein n=1 Tax=Naganishia liquefaciens TaxID=104408 RepID=A0A8H3TZ04_9TREE|nr:hypothetical protein NliqN6_6055 [Naganishia liquefaciens]
MTALLLPGQPLPAEFKQLQPGHGCYTSKDGILRASAIGYPRTANGVVDVTTGRPDTSALPDIGAIVTGVVSQLTPLQATVTMTLVNNLPTPVSSADFVGVIRVSDVRATEKDKVKIGKSFRLGDTVKAAVLSLGDARSYFLSTADKHLGVIAATSEAGNPMVPVSWQEMEDEVTGAREKRKVAKPEL